MVAGLPPGVRLICDDRQTLCRKHSDECVARSGAMFIGNSWQADGHGGAPSDAKMCRQHMAAMLLEPARGDHRAARRGLGLPNLAAQDRPPHVRHGLDHRREDDTGALERKKKRT
jgi:hypothetical protein